MSSNIIGLSQSGNIGLVNPQLGIHEEKTSIDGSNVIIKNPLQTYKKVSMFNHSTDTKVKTIAGDSNDSRASPALQ